MYLRRLIAPKLREAAGAFPAVLVTGARQSGKTTLLLNELADGTPYASLDDPIERDFAVSDPNGFLDRFEGHQVILDEIQYAPELFPYLKTRIDNNRHRNGRWILTGSQQFQLMRNVSESLAGRVAILELPPFSLLERKTKSPAPLSRILWTGGYPEPSLHPRTRDLWVRSYIQTYVERDLRQLQQVRDLRAFEQVVRLGAASHGQVFNAAAMARHAGVSLPTVKTWVGIMAASYLCLLLPPYFRNFGKRVVKTPKLYFIDSAIVCELTRQPSGEAALAGAMGGALFEGLMVSEAYKQIAASGNRGDMFFWRSHDGLEVDLILQTARGLVPVEIKLTATPTLRHMAPIDRFRKLTGPGISAPGVLVCRVPRRRALPEGNAALPWQDFPQWLREQLR